ncbi:CRTAC1 family protein [Mariniflexile sp. AS56]|uniref:CRTAC1 family protein n=1 Tax=Mariniflexile sp. AS56 TaxID=3063957 RepID=UPI0026EF1DE1|nr:CRTAC1 family protein [Mariniflexile sp. AS56]MDO7173124.1 CRTAC1 family protein [Mariniflexile sp. AS56]
MRYLILTIVLFSSLINAQENHIIELQNQIKFSEANSKIIPLEARSRRKFDNAVIADLDQDGYLDLLLTDHARRVEIFWNNKGTYINGKPFILGDTHGLAVGDYNQNGLIDILVQPGGGNGAKPSKTLSFQVNLDRTIQGGEAFSHFEGSRGRAVKFVDMNKDGVMDLVTSSFPGGTKLNHAHFLYEANKDLQFEFNKYLPTADAFNMRTLLTDFNNDDITDILFYGGKKILALKGNGVNDFEDVSELVLGDISNTENVNSISEIDFDNDGDLDLFLTRSKEPFDSESDYDENTKTFYFFERNKPFLYDNLKIKGDFKLENLQMAFPHFDVFIGANKKLFERKEDKHGQHDFTLTQEEAKGWPTDKSKKGIYIGYLGDGYWRIEGDTDAANSAVIHNVIEKPKVVILEDMPAKLLENRNGVFVDVSIKYGINISEQTTSSAIGDFNNDGWDDIFVVRYGHSASEIDQFLYRNDKGKKFVGSENHGIIRNELGATGMGADAFDYDKDGDLDIIYANERGRWHLFTNNTISKNNYLQVNIGNSPSGKATAVGASLLIRACNGTYKRIVGASSSPYSHSFNTYIHVGLGECDQVEEAVVTWSNGENQSLTLTGINKIYQAGKFLIF